MLTFAYLTISSIPADHSNISTTTTKSATNVDVTVDSTQTSNI
jgi:hypothetical protein